MKMKTVLLAIVLVAGVAAAISCRKHDIRYAIVEVPGMTDAKSVRIATNAALHEVVGRFDGIENDTEIDLSRNLILYHESQRLMSSAYRQRIRAKVAEVGYNAHVLGARLNPPRLVDVLNDNEEYIQVQMWPNRFTAVISVPNMKSQTDANIVIDAIAFARLGRDDPRIEVDAKSRKIVATYESLNLSQRNIEHAIAYAGFDANRIPARLGQVDSVPNRWTPIKL
jgi:hypothetical protein